MNDADQLPRVFQANVDRFYQRVILPALSQLSTHQTLTVGEASTMDEFLDRCAAQADNHTANEAAKAFALNLDGLFERQLSRWGSACGLTANDGDRLLQACALHASFDLVAAGVSGDLKELHLDANVVRHGKANLAWA